MSRAAHREGRVGHSIFPVGVTERGAAILLSMVGRALFLFFLVGSFPVVARAQGLGPWANHLPWERMATAKTGTWVEYVMGTEEKSTGPWLRFLALGQGPRGGVWVEIWISQRPGSASQAFRLLLRGDPGKPGGILEAHARLLGGAVQEIPVDLLPLGEERPGLPGERPSVSTEETAVQTEAGTFRAHLVEMGTGPTKVRGWFSRSIPLFGLVRLCLPEGQNLELHGMGEGGLPVIDVAKRQENEMPPP